MQINRAIVFIALIFCSCTQKIYVVRHAEKATVSGNSNMMSQDPPLSEAGQKRAEDLREVLKSKKIGYIFSTNFIRTRSTAEPTRAHFGIQIENYAPRPDDNFIHKVTGLKKNVLIVGHSNTIDDVVNKICGETKVPGDLDESIYDNLYILKRQGKKWKFENKKYGSPTP